MQTETNETQARRALPKFKPFDSFACVGDTREVECGPYLIRATLHHDGDTSPLDFECYGPDMIEAWRRDDWHYTGIVLSVYAGDICLDSHAAALWGVERNFPGSDNSYLSECADDLLADAIDAANNARAKILAALA